MTLKHVKFHQSEVMRELERQAARKGHFEPSPEETVDAAAHKTAQNFIPSRTGNWYNDTMNLVTALRNAGYKKSAADIEEKATNMKFAEVHLYKAIDEDGDAFMDYAHPEGDTEIIPAQDGRGKVERTTTTHDKMLDVLHKKPTGKLYGAASFVLNREVKEAALDVLKTAQDVGAIDEIKKKFESIQRIINNVGSIVSDTSLNFGNIIGKIFHGNASAVALYVKYSDVTLQKLQNLLYAYKFFYWNGSKYVVNTNQANKVISSHALKNQNALIAACNAIGIDAEPYFRVAYGSDSIPLISDENKAVELAGKVLGSTNFLWKTTFGEPIVRNANENVKKVYNNFIAEMKTILPVTSEGIIDRGEINYSVAINKLKNAKKSLDSVYAQGSNASKLFEIYEVFSADEAMNLQKIFTNLKSNIDEALKLIVAQSKQYGKTFKGINGWISQVARLKKLSLEQRAALPEGSEERKAAYSNYEAAKKMESILNGLKGKSWLEIRSVLEENYQLYETPEDFQKDIDLFEAKISKKNESAEASDGLATVAALVKTAGAFSDQAKTVKPVSTKTEPKATPKSTPGQSVQYKGPATPAVPEEEQRAVAQMQKVLTEISTQMTQNAENIARDLAPMHDQSLRGLTPDQVRQSAAVIGATGKGTGTPFDGLWGPKTIRALEEVNSYVQRVNKLEGKNLPAVLPGSHYRQTDTSKTLKDADANVTALLEFSKAMGFSVTGPDGSKTEISDYDHIPQTLTRQNVLETGDLTVRNVDVQSLEAFYAFLEHTINRTASGKSELVSKGQYGEITDTDQSGKKTTHIIRTTLEDEPKREGFGTVTWRQFNDYLKWFAYRVNMLYSKAKREGADAADVQRLTAYKDAIDALSIKWLKLKRWLEQNRVDLDKSYVSFEALKIVDTHLGRSGRGREVGVGRGRGEVGMEGYQYSDPGVVGGRSGPLYAPFSNNMNMVQIAKDFGLNDSKKFYDKMAIPVINYDSFGGQIDSLIRMYLPEDLLAQVDAGRGDPRQFLLSMIRRLTVDFNKIYKTWIQEAQTKLPEGERVSALMKNQRGNYDAWHRRLDYLEKRIRRIMES